MEHIMIDLETMGSKVNSPMLSISAVQFNPSTGEIGKEFDVAIKLEDSLKNDNIRPSADTILWWLAQDKTAQELLLLKQKKAITLPEALYLLNQFVHSISIKDSKVWGNSARFDLGIIDYSCTQVGTSLSWKYSNERDVRTILALAPEIKQTAKFEGIPHNGIDDCKYQIQYVSGVYKKYNL